MRGFLPFNNPGNRTRPVRTFARLLRRTYTCLTWRSELAENQIRHAARGSIWCPIQCGNISEPPWSLRRPRTSRSLIRAVVGLRKALLPFGYWTSSLAFVLRPVQSLGPFSLSTSFFFTTIFSDSISLWSQIPNVERPFRSPRAL